MPPAEHITGLVLSGGGARAAYQVGALRAIAKLMPRANAQPFPVIDNAPLAALLRSGMDLARIEQHVASGHLRALGINATSYGTGHAVTFFEAASTVADWWRARRRGERCRLGIPHLMASTAIPFVFPAARVDAGYYMDGSVRQIAPLSPALHLGARRILVLAVGQITGQAPPEDHRPRQARRPSLGQIAGHALSSVFLDNLGADLERLYQVNRLLRVLPKHEVVRSDFAASIVDVFVLFPSRDLGAFALRYADRLPRGVRYLLRGHGSTQGTGSNLLSYLLFDREFARALIKLGHDDAMARRDELSGFLDGASAGYVPLFPRELR